MGRMIFKENIDLNGGLLEAGVWTLGEVAVGGFLSTEDSSHLIMVRWVDVLENTVSC